MPKKATMPAPAPKVVHALDTFSDAELRAELDRRAAEERRRAEEAAKARARIIERHVGALLDLVPHHSRKSCSDDDFDQEDPGCTRCALLTTQDTGWWDPDVRLVIETRP